MSILIPILIVASLAGVILGLVPAARARSFSNSVVGTHEGGVTRLSDAALSTCYLLGTAGSDASHIAVCGASERPLGVIVDEAESSGEDVAVQLLGSASSTVRMVASGSVSAGTMLYTSGSGRVGALSSTAGTYYCVGIALTAASSDGDVVEVDPCVARETVVS